MRPTNYHMTADEVCVAARKGKFYVETLMYVAHCQAASQAEAILFGDMRDGVVSTILTHYVERPHRGTWNPKSLVELAIYDQMDWWDDGDVW